MEPLLRAESLVKNYDDITAVNDISFDIYPGEIFGFLGPNGAGKTTTIKIMCGLLKPDRGNVTINPINGRKSIGFCPQHIVIWENLTCFEQIIFTGQMYDMTVSEARYRGEELLNSLGLNSIKDRLAKKLSGGMQRRLNIALALIHSPQILFLDEPQAGLDPQSRVLVREYIRSIRENTTIVLTTHDMEEAEKLSDRICIIDNGKLLVTGTADEIKKTGGNADLIEVKILQDSYSLFLSSLDNYLTLNMTLSPDKISFRINDPIQAISDILKVVEKHNIKIENLTMRKNSLEDVFINLTGKRLRE